MGKDGLKSLLKQRALSVDAMEARIHALSEYLAVYRAVYASEPDSATYARIRELRWDILRLRAWMLYLLAKERQPWWLRPLEGVARLFADLVPSSSRSRYRHRRVAQTMRRLPTASLLDRAYAAREDEGQGRLITLQLADHHRPDANRARMITQIEKDLQLLRGARKVINEEAKEATVVCQVLARVLRLAQCVGISVPVVDTVDR